MRSLAALDKIYVNILNLEINYAQLDELNSADLNLLTDRLLAAGYELDHLQLANALTCLGHIFPRIDSTKRAATLRNMVNLALGNVELYGKSAVRFLEPRLILMLSEDERAGLAGLIREFMSTSFFMQRETGVWALVRIIPYLHEFKMKEYTHCLFELREDPHMRNQILDALTSLIFSLCQEHRKDIAYFISEGLKRSTSISEKYFIIELNKQLLASLEENDRTLIADLVAPILFHSDPDLVRQALNFFSKGIALLPRSQRYHYGQIIASLLNDRVVGNDVVFTLESLLGHITNESDQAMLRHQMQNPALRANRERDDASKTVFWEASAYLN